MEYLFNQLIEPLHTLDEINFKNLFIDGTKIEAKANCYSFCLWKRKEKNRSTISSGSTRRLY